MSKPHETYVVFHSDKNSSGKYNLSIKTTPKQITSFEIISAILPIIPNVRYLSMKISNMENTISLNDDNLSIDNTFALFQFNRNKKHGYIKFNQKDIHPNKIFFENRLLSLYNLHVNWKNQNNEDIIFLKPRHNIGDVVFFILHNDVLVGTIINVSITSDIKYNIQDINYNNICIVSENNIIKHYTNDRVFVMTNGKYMKGVMLNDNEIYLSHNKTIITVK